MYATFNVNPVQLSDYRDQICTKICALELTLRCLAAEATKYEKQLELWNEANPVEARNTGKNGTTVRSQVDSETQSKKGGRTASKAER
jgi:hypothetical protein